MLAFSLVSVLGLYFMLRAQHHLPFSLGYKGMEQGQSFNTAASFVTNTNWQSYSGESTLGYTAQMAGLGRAELRVGRSGHLRRDRTWCAASRGRELISSATSGST